MGVTISNVKIVQYDIWLKYMNYILN